jgi:hypothetical protein
MSNYEVRWTATSMKDVASEFERRATELKEELRKKLGSGSLKGYQERSLRDQITAWEDAAGVLRATVIEAEPDECAQALAEELRSMIQVQGHGVFLEGSCEENEGKQSFRANYRGHRLRVTVTKEES